VWGKVEEELAELQKACSSGDQQRTAEELGDLFFSLVNLSRFLGVQSEDALAQATQRFIKRFNYVESRLQNEGKSPAESSLEIMNRLWDEAKAREQNEKNPP
jgi:uncharacterized protein YabN with tetrapyrrole methylase and pyrophosphatase domain